MDEILFDNSLIRLVEVVKNNLGDHSLHNGVILRDATGRLSFVAPEEAVSDEKRTQIQQSLYDVLGPYARSGSVITFKGDFGTDRILQDQSRLPVQVDGVFCQLIDRRIVGAGWLETPNDEAKGLPRIVFASLKGGVGRSTAISVTAADLARRNRNVLVVDLDLEAPGIGDLLLDQDRMPQFGVVDFLVENGIGGVPDARLDDFVGSSALTTGGGGRVDVVPALGRQATIKPENVLPKLARAMIEDVTEDGQIISVSSQISIMIDRLTARAIYDVVLIDSRAGLSELAAPAVLGLGATTLLFGTAQKQTIEGYRALFAALQLLAQRDRAANRRAEWRLMLKAVYAKASFNEDVAARHKENLYELFADHLYDAEEEEDSNIMEDKISFDIDDPNAPHWPLVIPFNQNFIEFDPLHNPGQLTQAFYEQTFRPFLNDIDTIINAVVNSGSITGEPV